MRPNNLEKLWQLAKNDAMHFEPVGLILQDIKNEGYESTPKNSLVFASTGGDGVHFSFLCDNFPNEKSPIVMTVPMNDDNIIVGENLLEFLALGCRYGYFALEQLSYDRDETLSMLNKKEFWDDYTDFQKELLEEISTAFLLKPWNDHAKRLSELDSMYLKQLIAK